MRARKQLERWGVPTAGTGAYVACMGGSRAALDGFILWRMPRDNDRRLKGDIEGALLAGPRLLRLVCEIADIKAGTRLGLRDV